MDYGCNLPPPPLEMANQTSQLYFHQSRQPLRNFIVFNDEEEQLNDTFAENACNPPQRPSCLSN